MEQVYKHIGKLIVGGCVTLVFSGFAYVGSTYESRLHDRINAVESNASKDSDRLTRIEQKLDDLITEVRRANRGTVEH